VEHDVPDLNWFECPMLQRVDMLAVIQRNTGPEYLEIRHC